ncbi:MAG: RNA polymerase subunit sigma, partial [Candidatus Marinimicrobia bacterium]|nr:RNA polymerase subunit sigma [Candidatus Neomarinimicrobiota bacterium]
MAKKVKRIGGDTNRSLSKYLEEIGQYEPLDPKDE